ncbi:MAG: hypothetical protein OXG15_09895 [Gammaproteobacteria bacterium]|nr:hypothetical protein [Gammaproteobacteria bacterium]
MTTKRGKTQRYECKTCHKTFTKRTGTLNYRHRKQHLRDKITGLYCEGMSLRAISRYLKINFKTVVRYFLENADEAWLNNQRRLSQGGIKTTYVQFDELETFEHTKKKPLGVQVSIRAKTGEIIETRVCKIPVKALAVSQSYIRDWNSNIDRSHKLFEMLWNTKRALNKTHATIACDKARSAVKVAEDVFFENNFQVYASKERNKRIDLTFLKMRQDISRLRRRTLAITKRRDNLQKHLDLYTDYHNTKRIA